MLTTVPWCGCHGQRGGRLKCTPRPIKRRNGEVVTRVRTRGEEKRHPARIDPSERASLTADVTATEGSKRRRELGVELTYGRRYRESPHQRPMSKGSITTNAMTANRFEPPLAGRARSTTSPAPKNGRDSKLANAA